MKRLIISMSLGASALLPVAAHAQAVPPAIVAVVDVDRVTTQCNACKTASASLQSQLTALQNRQQTLAGTINTEGESIQAAVNALNGKEADAALKARAQAWATKRDQANQELQRQEQQLKANSDYVNKQIVDKLNPIFSQVMQRRGANILVSQNATLATATNVDVTNDVLAALNNSLTTISTTAPAAPRTNTPQGR
jgi:outer membrane protein